MKRLLLVVFLLIAPGSLFAADLVPLDYEFPVYGSVVDNTFKSTLDNTAKSVQTLAEAAGITWLQDGRPPQGMIFSVETYDARMGTGNITTANGIGHVVAAGSSGRLSGAAYISNTYFTTKTQGSNAVIQITLER
jgi:hypothetical protein